MKTKTYTGYVITGDTTILLQLFSDNQWGFVLADEDQEWAGGIGSGHSEWTPITEAAVPADVKDQLQWVLDSARMVSVR